MDHAGRVGGGQRSGDLDADVQRALEPHRTVRERLRERFAVHVLEDNVGTAVDVENVIDRGDARIVEARRRARFTVEARLGVGGCQPGLGGTLQRDAPAEPFVLREIHLAHSACSELAQHAERSDGLTVHGETIP